MTPHHVTPTTTALAVIILLIAGAASSVDEVVPEADFQLQGAGEVTTEVEELVEQGAATGSGTTETTAYSSTSPPPSPPPSPPQSFADRLVKRLDNPVDSAEDGKNSKGLDKLLGSRKYSKLGKHGHVKPPGYSYEDAHTGPDGHYYMGPSRRRIGAGFGRRRRSAAPAPPGTGGHMTEDLKKMVSECEAAMASSKDKDSIESELQQTAVKGSVIDSHEGEGLAGVRVTWVDYATGQTVPGDTTTNEGGTYTIQLPRCSLYFVHYAKPSYITTVGQCEGEPIILWGETESVSEALAANMKHNELIATMGWRRNDKYAKDLDLHLLVPGRRDVLLKKFEHLDRAGHKHVDYQDVKYAANNTGAKVKSFKKGTDLGNHRDILDDPEHIYWDHVGYEDHYPYAKYEIDHGSEDGLENSGGPETVHVTKTMPGKQYLLWVDCWSCDEEEDEWDEDKKVPLTAAALLEFSNSRATVKVFQGTKQLSCSSMIPHKTSKITTRWDATMVQCTEDNTCHVNNDIGFNSAYPTVPLLSHSQAPPSNEEHPVGFMGCYDSRQGDKLDWLRPSRDSKALTANNLGEARVHCKGYPMVALDCPTSGGAEVWCIRQLGEAKKLDDKECTGQAADLTFNSGKNGHCVGPYTMPGANGGTGGWHRAAVYAAAEHLQHEVEQEPAPTASTTPTGETTAGSYGSGAVIGAL